jgi:hypothetical protein
MKLYRSINSKDRGVDPFDCSSIPITQEVHHLLTYFGTLFFKHKTGTQTQSPFHDSACFQVIQDSIFDEVQMKCIVATMASRREHFDGQKSKGRSTKLLQVAVQATRKRLEQPGVNTQLIYSIMKLCHAEAYRTNFDTALVHLHGARAALEQLGSWKDLDQAYTPTFCGFGYAFHVSKVWRQPASFPCLVDPGRAISCLPPNVIDLFPLNDSSRNGTGQKLLAAVASSSCNSKTLASLQQIISELIEYSILKHMTLQLDERDPPLTALVAKWTDLRRYALLSKLLSVAITHDDFLHAMRVSLVLWLTQIANYMAYDRDLQLVAQHLQDVMIQLLPYEEKGHPEIISWMLMMGAMAGDARYVKSWFILQLSNFAGKSDTLEERSAEDWVIWLEDICRETLYCKPIQRDSLVLIAERIFSERLISCVEALT